MSNCSADLSQSPNNASYAHQRYRGHAYQYLAISDEMNSTIFAAVAA